MPQVNCSTGQPLLGLSLTFWKLHINKAFFSAARSAASPLFQLGTGTVAFGAGFTCVEVVCFNLIPNLTSVPQEGPEAQLAASHTLHPQTEE